MKFLILIVCTIQVVFGAPNQPSVAEQTQQTIEKIQQNAQEAVKQFNDKVLEVTGASNNVDLLNRVQTGAENYAKEIKGVADQIKAQADQNKQGMDASIKDVANQLSEQAAKLLGRDDAAKVTELQNAFTNVIKQADDLNARLQTEGGNIQNLFADALSKIYENTVKAAQNVAQQIDASRAPAS